MTVRSNDPATSHLAATYINGKRPGLRDAFLQALRVLGNGTANEIAQWCVQHGVSANQESVRKRAKELVDAGLAKYGPARKCSVTGMQAGTLELCHVDRDGSESQEADGPASAGNLGQSRTSRAASGAVQGQQSHDSQHPEAQTIPTPEAERAKACVEFVNCEREWIETWRAAMELHKLAKTLGTWPIGSVEEYIVALEAAAGQGLIDRDGGRVRRKRVVAESKVVQKGLFE